MFSSIVARNALRQIARRSFSSNLLPNTNVANNSLQPIPSILRANLPCQSFHTSGCLMDASNPSSNSFNVQDDDDFKDRVLKSKKPVIVDFHAEWCGPCKMLGPKIEKEVDKHNGKVLLAKVDVDDHGATAMKYKIMVVPSVLAFKNGEVTDKFEGNIDDSLLESFVSRSFE